RRAAHVTVRRQRRAPGVGRRRKIRRRHKLYVADGVAYTENETAYRATGGIVNGRVITLAYAVGGDADDRPPHRAKCAGGRRRQVVRGNSPQTRRAIGYICSSQYPVLCACVK